MYQYLLLIDNDEERRFFEQIYNEYKNEMYLTANRILKNRLDAEDIVHETFMAVVNNIKGIMKDPPQKNRNYILTITTNKSFNLYKKKKWESESELELDEMEDVFEEGLEAQIVKMENRELILKLLRQMSSSYRDVLLLQYYHELDVAEIADIMERTPDNIRHISMRAKRKLHKLLEEYGDLEE